jgi:hypothetical protein
LIKYFKQAEKEDATKPELYARWVDLMFRREKKEEAIRIAQKGLEIFPGDVGLSNVESKLKSF